jgi:hypothetical protein
MHWMSCWEFPLHVHAIRGQHFHAHQTQLLMILRKTLLKTTCSHWKIGYDGWKSFLSRFVDTTSRFQWRNKLIPPQSRSNNHPIHEAGSPSNPNGNSQAGSSSSHSAPSPHNTSSANHSSPRSLLTSGDSSSSEESDNEAIPLEQLLAQLELNPNTPRIAGATASTQLLRRAAGVTHKIQLDGSSGDFPLNIFLPDGRPMMRRPEYWQMDQVGIILYYPGSS